MEARKKVNKEYLRSLLTEFKDFDELMLKLMKLGKEISDEYGGKDYNSPEEFFLDIKNKTSPLFMLDGDIETDPENIGTNLICVKNCPVKDVMKEMSESGTSDAQVDTIMSGHMLREGEKSNFIDLGCYVMQQLRQMMISSITVKGEYVFNYIHLGCDKGTGKRTISEGDVESVGIDKNALNRLLDKYDCCYTISYREGQE